MPLPPPAPRQIRHTRQVVYQGFEREDGLWDIEGQLLDTKTYTQPIYERGALPPGTPIHDISIRVTVDDAYVIHAAVSSMDSKPFAECLLSQAPLQQMVGVTMGPGWRVAIDRVMGGTRSCTHLRELLFNLATAAYQTIPHAIDRRRVAAGLPAPPPSDQPPYHLGRCMAWDFNGPVVARHYPRFIGWAPLRRVDKPAES